MNQLSLGLLLAATCVFLIDSSAYAHPLGLPKLVIPADNPQTTAKIRLGKQLFHDQRFSATGTVSCANCHDEQNAFTDSPLATSEGINQQRGTRNSPTVLNSAYLDQLFWDGRANSLEEQAALPFINPIEMGLADFTPILQIVRSDQKYRYQFAQVFGQSGDAITMREVTQAIASYERTLVAANSAFDRYYFGNDETALTAAQQQGFVVFQNSHCMHCHTINTDHALFTDQKFHNLGIGFSMISAELQAMMDHFMEEKAKGMDIDVAVLMNPQDSELGRFVVTGNAADLGAFKTPTLRDVALTAPYMHNGSLATLTDVVEFYNTGGHINGQAQNNPYLSDSIRPLNLDDQQKQELVEFMKALTSNP